MQYTRESAIDRLLESYRAYYNITMFEEERKPLTAVCEFFQCSQRYVISKKANLWSANCEEFVYVYDMEHMTVEAFEECRAFAWEDAGKRANIGPNHMYTYVTAVFLCDTCQEAARKRLKKSRNYKSFQYSLHGWMDFHTAVLEVKEGNRITSNRGGKRVEEVLKNVLLQNNKKRRRFL